MRTVVYACTDHGMLYLIRVMCSPAPLSLSALSLSLCSLSLSALSLCSLSLSLSSSISLTLSLSALSLVFPFQTTHYSSHVLTAARVNCCVHVCVYRLFLRLQLCRCMLLSGSVAAAAAVAEVGLREAMEAGDATLGHRLLCMRAEVAVHAGDMQLARTALVRTYMCMCDCTVCHCMYEYASVCMYVCMYVHVYMCVYV